MDFRKSWVGKVDFFCFPSSQASQRAASASTPYARAHHYWAPPLREPSHSHARAHSHSHGPGLPRSCVCLRSPESGQRPWILHTKWIRPVLLSVAAPQLGSTPSSFFSLYVTIILCISISYIFIGTKQYIGKNAKWTIL